MFRVLAVFGLIFLTGLVYASPVDLDDLNKISVKFVTKDELKKLLNSFPNAEPMQLNSAKSLGVGKQGKDVIRYTLGNRIRGDRRVANKQHNNNWSVPQDVELELTYPDSGIGAVISYIEIIVDQSSTQGQAYVLRGGVGQRYVTLILEAINTSWFNYDVFIYGQE